MMLIRELAEYEQAGGQVLTTEAQLEADGFGEQPKFSVLLVECDEEVQGLAFYYPRYSTWVGPTLYLEDLIIRKESRGKGLGLALMQALEREAKAGGYHRLEWQVLDWNTPAIDFYKRYGAETDETWVNCRIEP